MSSWWQQDPNVSSSIAALAEAMRAIIVLSQYKPYQQEVEAGGAPDLASYPMRIKIAAALHAERREVERADALGEEEPSSDPIVAARLARLESLVSQVLTTIAKRSFGDDTIRVRSGSYKRLLSVVSTNWAWAHAAMSSAGTASLHQAIYEALSADLWLTLPSSHFSRVAAPMTSDPPPEQPLEEPLEELLEESATVEDMPADLDDELLELDEEVDEGVDDDMPDSGKGEEDPSDLDVGALDADNADDDEDDAFVTAGAAALDELPTVGARQVTIVTPFSASGSRTVDAPDDPIPTAPVMVRASAPARPPAANKRKKKEESVDDADVAALLDQVDGDGGADFMLDGGDASMYGDMDEDDMFDMLAGDLM